MEKATLGKVYLIKNEAGRPPECSFLLIYEIEISQVYDCGLPYLINKISVI